jgi:hypothetical protein
MIRSIEPPQLTYQSIGVRNQSNYGHARRMEEVDHE